MFFYLYRIGNQFFYLQVLDYSNNFKKWENKLLEISLWMIRYRKEFWFFGNEVALSLGYTEPKKAIQDHIDSRDKMGIEELFGSKYKMVLDQYFLNRGISPPFEFFHKLHPKQKLVKEIGLYSLCIKSRMPKVAPFQRWVYETIKEIRETGSYTLPNGPIDNPLDLVAKIETFEKETLTLKKETKTFDKGTQTKPSIKEMKKSFEKLKNEMEMSLERMEEETENLVVKMKNTQLDFD